MELAQIKPKETQVCKSCGRELSLTQFKTTRWGKKASVCNVCVIEKLKENKYAKSEDRRSARLIYDSQFDNMQPREVIEIMSRAKLWLESRGYTITLRGEYREVKVHTVRF